MSAGSDLKFPRDEWVGQLVRQSLAEDIGTGDVSTTVAVTTTSRAHGLVVARQPGVVAGLPILEMVFEQLDSQVVVEISEPDGTPVVRGTTIATLTGPTSSLLTGERVAINFLQHLSGIATATAAFVARAAGTGCKILDTRKTLPGYRALAKYAVRAGGGHNHRMGLYDRVMLKDNHWAAGRGTIADLVRDARNEYPDLMIEVEVDTLEQLQNVLPLGVEWILLDNYSLEDITAAVQLRAESAAARSTLLEVSGNINLDTIADHAGTGVDAASSGWLTHSAPALDISLDLQPLADQEN